MPTHSAEYIRSALRVHGERVAAHIRVLGVYSVRTEILARVCLDGRRITADRVHGQHTL